MQLHKQLKFVAVLWGEASKESKEALSCAVLSFNEVLSRAGNRSIRPVSMAGNDLATLVFTSGTTGSPKVPSIKTHPLGIYSSSIETQMTPPSELWHCHIPDSCLLALESCVLSCTSSHVEKCFS